MKEGKNEMEKIEKKKKAKKGYFSNEEMLNLLIERNQLKEIEELTKEQELRLKRIQNQIGILFFKISERLMPLMILPDPGGNSVSLVNGLPAKPEGFLYLPVWS